MNKGLTVLNQIKIGSTSIYTRDVEDQIDEKYLVLLTEDEYQRFSDFKHLRRKANFLGIRIIAKELDTLNEIAYMAIGSPYLINNPSLHISISHSKNTCALATNPNHIIGLDIEFHTGQASKLRSRFIHEDENALLLTPIEDTLAWSAKEALYKIGQTKGLSFKNQLRLIQHNRTEQFFNAHIDMGQSHHHSYIVYYKINGDFIITLAEPIL